MHFGVQNKVKITNIQFASNQASFGSNIYLGDNNTIEIDSVIFNDSLANYGGILYIDKNNILKMSNVTAINLTATTSGGFFFANLNNNISIQLISIKNIVESIFSLDNGNHLQIQDCEIDGN